MNTNIKSINYPFDEDFPSNDDDSVAVFTPCRHRELRIVEPLVADERQPQYTNCPAPIDRQIAALASLEDGWYDETSRKYEPDELRCAARLLGSVCDTFRLPIPYIYPTPDGLVRAEWSSDKAEVILNIDLCGKTADAIAALVGPDDVDELTVQLSDHDAERVLGSFLSRYLRRG